MNPFIGYKLHAYSLETVKRIESKLMRYFSLILYGRVDLDKATVVFQSSGCEDVVEAFKAVHDATEVFYRSREWNGTGTERETSWKNINCLANDFKDTVSHHLEIILVQSIRSGLLSRLRGSG